MISLLETLIELVIKYGAWGISIVLIGIILYFLRVILDEDRSALWRARFYKALYKISGKSEAEKKYIENDVCSKINLARRSMPFGKEYLPKAIKIQWIESGRGETTQIKENDFIIRLDPAESQEKNIVLIANALVKQTSLVGIRYVLERPLEAAIDLNLVKNLLKEVGNKRILDWYLRNEYVPTIESSAEIKEWNGKIVEIDERGLFTRLLLVELDDYSKRVAGKTQTKEMFEEIAGLIDFLYKISTKAYGQDAPLDYITKNIKIGVILVGETSKILFSGIGPYLRAFAYKTQQQLNSIYVIQFDKEWLGDTDFNLYQEFVEITRKLDEKIMERFQVQKDLELKYTCTDAQGNKRQVKISRYIPIYES